MSKDLWSFAEIKTPPMGEGARKETGFLLRMLQEGGRLSMPQSRPMPRIGKGCHELRVTEKDVTWRTIYYLGKTEILVLEVFSKKTNKTPQSVVDLCKERLKAYKQA